MLVVSLLQTVAALGFLAIGPGRLWIAYAAQGLVAGLGAFFGPASQAAVANLVEPEDLPVAMSTLGATWGTMLAVGATVGGIFTKACGFTKSNLPIGLQLLSPPFDEERMLRIARMYEAVTTWSAKRPTV